jgi:hypothetical protein
MLTAQIIARSHKGPFLRAGETHEEVLVFDKTLDDQEVVRSLHQRLGKIPRRAIRTHGIPLAGYRYIFRFFRDGKPDVAYWGLDYYPVWHVGTSAVDSTTLEYPEDIVRELHESIGLPWSLPPGHR